MRNSFASITIAALIVIAPHCVSAQTKDITEFRKGWRFPLELSQGFVGSHQAYAGIASFSAMYTLVPGSLRIGAVAGPMMSGGDVQGLGGARLAWCIVKGPEMIFGTPANVQIQIDHQWSTENFAIDRKSTRLNSSHGGISRMPSSA